MAVHQTPQGGRQQGYQEDRQIQQSGIARKHGGHSKGEPCRQLRLYPRPEDALVFSQGLVHTLCKLSLSVDELCSLQEATKGYLWDVFRTPRMRCRFINLYFIWFVKTLHLPSIGLSHVVSLNSLYIIMFVRCVTSLVYYGLSLNSSNLGGNDYINFFIAGAVEVPAYVCSQLAMSYLGRRLSLTGTMLLGGLALFAILFTPVG